jgi:hypothetical protein
MTKATKKKARQGGPRGVDRQPSVTYASYVIDIQCDHAKEHAKFQIAGGIVAALAIAHGFDVLIH